MFMALDSFWSNRAQLLFFLKTFKIQTHLSSRLTSFDKAAIKKQFPHWTFIGPQMPELLEIWTPLNYWIQVSPKRLTAICLSRSQSNVCLLLVLVLQCLWFQSVQWDRVKIEILINTNNLDMPGYQNSLSTLPTCFIFPSWSQPTVFFILEEDCLFLIFTKTALYFGTQMLIGHRWKKRNQEGFISMFDFIVLENKFFGFFCQGLKWRYCNFSWLLAWTTFYSVQ